MASIDFIYFDLGNVILDFDHEKGCRQISRIANVPPSTVHSAIFDTGLDRRFETGAISSNDFFEEFCENAECQLDRHEFLSAACDIFSPNQGIFPLITQLRAVNFPIGLLSNTCLAHWEYVLARYSILREFFAPIILSFEVHFMKPDKQIYECALSQVNHVSDRCFFVDDRLDNVEGAKANGMDAVCYQSVPRLIAELNRRGVSINL